MNEYKDNKIIKLFKENDSKLLEIELENEKVLKVWNIAWGYDLKDEFAHITSNISPKIEDSQIDIFYTNDIVKIFDFNSKEIIYKKTPTHI